MPFFLENHPKLKLVIINCTDSRGSEEANLVLFEKRAKAVYENLIIIGIDRRRLLFNGGGESNLIYSVEEIFNERDNKTKEQMHHANQRTEMVLVGLD